MANISDVSGIVYECETEETAKILFKFLKSTTKGAYYTMVENPELDGLYIRSEGASGRWAYNNNIRYCFETPETWLNWAVKPNPKQKALFDKLLERLKAGEAILVDWSDQEGGCDVFGDGSGRIEYSETTQSLSFDYEFTDDDEARERYMADEEAEEIE